MADLFEAIIGDLSNYCLGIVERIEGAGSKVLGSGVLVQVDGRRGILTAGHVAEKFNQRKDIGWVRFIGGPTNRHFLDFSDAQNFIFESSDDWTEDGADLGFSLLGPETAASIEARGVFLNMEKKRNEERFR